MPPARRPGTSVPSPKPQHHRTTNEVLRELSINDLGVERMQEDGAMPGLVKPITVTIPATAPTTPGEDPPIVNRV
jgi:hypothetical protein